MPNLKGWEIVIILALLLLLFGAKRLPDTARGLGRSLRILKAETKGLRDDDGPEPATAARAPALEPPLDRPAEEHGVRSAQRAVHQPDDEVRRPADERGRRDG